MKQFLLWLCSPFVYLLKRLGLGKGHADTHDVERILGNLSIFSRMSSRQLSRLASRLIARQHKAGEVIIHKGDKGLGMFILATGSVEVYDVQDGRKVSLSILDKGSCVGEMSLIDAQPRSASVLALEDCDTFLLTRENFARLFRRDPEILWGIVPVLTERLRQTSTRVAHLSKSAPDAPPAPSEKQPAQQPPAAAASAAPATASDAPGPTAVPTAATHADPPTNANQEQEPNAALEQAANAEQNALVEQTEEPQTTTPAEDNLMATMAQLAFTSFMFFSSTMIINTQSNLRLLLRRDSLRENIEKRANLLNALTEHAEGDMDDDTKKLYETYHDFLNSLSSILDKK